MDRQATVLIGVDGGGTGCRVRITDLAFAPLAEARGGAANVTSDRPGALADIQAALAEAGEAAGLTLEHLHNGTIHLGLAGVMSDAIAAEVAQALPFAHITVTDDRPTTVTGALAGKDGYVIAAGTGSFIAAQQGGRRRYVGGWGMRVSDQASAARLGQMALEQTLLCYDGLVAQTDLTRSILTKFSDDPNGIVTFATTASPREFGQYARLVVDAANAGDGIGVMIMRNAVDYLITALRSLGFHAGDALCLTGGVGPSYLPYLPADMQRGVIPAKGTALDGAIRLAAQNHPT